MPNIASVLKEEIARLARKEMRNETEALKKASAHYRSDIAALKRRVTDLEKLLAQLLKKAVIQSPQQARGDGSARVRFTAKGLRTLRQRLGLSAAELGSLLEVSAQTVYNWEAESTRPRPQQVAAIAAIRSMGKREAAARLQQLAAQ